MLNLQGYITTLTDRLRSCQGEKWSLACRVTDGTATTEVSIADQVKYFRMLRLHRSAVDSGDINDFICVVHFLVKHGQFIEQMQIQLYEMVEPIKQSCRCWLYSLVLPLQLRHPLTLQ